MKCCNKSSFGSYSDQIGRFDTVYQPMYGPNWIQLCIFQIQIEIKIRKISIQKKTYVWINIYFKSYSINGKRCEISGNGERACRTCINCVKRNNAARFSVNVVILSSLRSILSIRLRLTTIRSSRLIFCAFVHTTHTIVLSTRNLSHMRTECEREREKCQWNREK